MNALEATPSMLLAEIPDNACFAKILIKFTTGGTKTGTFDGPMVGLSVALKDGLIDGPGEGSNDGLLLLANNGLELLGK